MNIIADMNSGCLGPRIDSWASLSLSLGSFCKGFLSTYIVECRVGSFCKGFLSTYIVECRVSISGTVIRTLRVQRSQQSCTWVTDSSFVG